MILGPDGQPARPLDPMTSVERAMARVTAEWMQHHIRRTREMLSCERVRALRESLGAPTFQAASPGDVVRAKLPDRYRR